MGRRAAARKQNAFSHASETPLKVIRGGKKDAALTQVNIAGIPKAKQPCHWCGRLFTPTRDWQLCCTPAKERGKVHQRKKALVGALAAYLRKLGVQAWDYQRLAKACVADNYMGVFKAMAALGYRYDMDAQVWLSEKQWRTS